MLVAQTNAWHWIGRINPGVGYEWVQTNGQWFLYIPEKGSVHVSVFWVVFPLFLYGIAIYEMLAYLRRMRRANAASE